MPSITPSPNTGPNAAMTPDEENVSLSRSICWTSSCRYTMNIGSDSSCGSAPEVSSCWTGSSRRSRASSVYGSRTSPEIASSKEPKSSRSSKSCSMLISSVPFSSLAALGRQRREALQHWLRNDFRREHHCLLCGRQRPRPVPHRALLGYTEHDPRHVVHADGRKNSAGHQQH